MQAFAVFTSICVLVLFSGCGHSTATYTETQSSTADISSPLTAMDWSTTGSVDLKFKITPSASGDSFLIQVSEYNSAPNTTSITLSASTNYPAYIFVSQLFQGAIQPIQGTVCSNSCGYTTSTTIHLASGLSRTISSPTVAGNPVPQPFDDLTAYITTQL